MKAYTKQCGIVILGLSFLFAGIWTADKAALEALNPPGGDLAMRFASFGVYLVVFLVSLHASRASLSPERTALREHKFLTYGIVIGVVLYSLGVALAVGSGAFIGSAAPNSIALIALVLLKCVGAPLSIALVWLYARLPYRVIVRTAVVGILAAFILEAVINAVIPQLAALPSIAFAIGSTFILVACLCCLIALRRENYSITQQQNSRTKNNISSDANKSPEPLSAQPTPVSLCTLINRNIAAGIVIASMMLGYLRAGYSTQDPYLLPGVIVVLLVIALLAYLTPFIGMQELFRGAIVCTAAGLLLAPLLSSIAPDAGDMLAGIGSALFEAVVLTVAIIITRSCTSPLRAAAAARLAVVVGHLVGSAVAASSMAWSTAHPEELNAVGLAIAFCYLILMFHLSSNPSASLPFTAGHMPRPLTTTEESPNSHSISAQPGRAGNTVDKTTASLTSSRAALDATLWKEPCATIAQSAGLTPRETEVLEQLAQGRDLAYMEEKFVLSRNTLKMHIRHVYAKLGVHDKQTVIDLVEATRNRS